MKFDYTLDFEQTDFRKRPELYRVGRGEQGVLLVEPYKGEILPHWRFKTPEAARESAAKIYELYEGYKSRERFRRDGHGAQVLTDGLDALSALCQTPHREEVRRRGAAGQEGPKRRARLALLRPRSRTP